ncbi:MAG: lipid II flippase MurJ [Ramlibacter sp.]
MFLRAGALSLALLLASRLLGVLRESAQAAAFGRSGMADVAVLLLTLPDWLTSIVASGALAYVLLPAWAGQPAAAVAALQRRVAVGAAALAMALALGLVLMRVPALRLLAGGLAPGMRGPAAQGLVWSAVAFPPALLAALWATRLQHERDFAGMYGANLVVNLVLIASIAVAGNAASRPGAIVALGGGLLVAMGARLLWLGWRLPRRAAPAPVTAGAGADPAGLPGLPVWVWAMLSAGLPLALPFAARSAASQAGEGALAVFNYSWKLVELPLVLAIQLVASLAFPAIARALSAGPQSRQAGDAIRQAFALAWTLACAAVAALAFAAPSLAALLFGWGRMPADALRQVAAWGLAGSWGLLPQAVTAVALTVLATQRRMGAAVAAYAVGLLALVGAGLQGERDGLALMHLLNASFTLVAAACLWALGAQRAQWLPWPAFGWSAAGLLAAALLAPLARGPLAGGGIVAGLAAGAIAACCVLGLALWRSPELRRALRR